MKNLKIFTNNIEQSAREQIDLLLEQEAFKDCKIRIMPDVHAGAGCVIGFTGNLGDKVIPNIVGVDIGCGMLCAELLNADIDLKKLDEIIREYIPSGMNVHKEKIADFNFEDLYCFNELKNKDKWLDKSLGTLGGGNHFIELDVDDYENKYLVIHTGSRNLGKQVAEIYQEKAIEYCSYKKEMQEERNKIIKEYKEQGREKEISSTLLEISNKYQGKTKLPKELCYLEGQLRDEYLHDMKICQRFAEINREYILKTICEKMNFIIKDSFQCIHNYINFNDNIVRKGAISARENEIVIIPINMKDGCIIGKGKGNEDWNYSAPHGAGRIMSRNQAKEKIKIEDYEKAMKGIYTTSVNNETIDEAPMVYKPIEEIMNNIKDTVEIQMIIKPIYNFKASE